MAPHTPPPSGGRAGRVALALAAATGLLAGAGGCAVPLSDARAALPVVGADGTHLFDAVTSPWTTPLPAGAPVDPRSTAVVAQLLTEKPVVSVNGWTVPVYDADATTPRYRVTATGGVVRGGWTLPAVPVPAAAVPDPQDDGHLVIVDRSSRCVYELREAGVVRSPNGGGTWTASWVNATPADGDGRYPDGLSTRSSGLSAAAGLIWPQELAAGRIDHALAFSSPFTADGPHVTPATAAAAGPPAGNPAAALPEGARLRLDPTLDLDTLKLTPQERTIAVALQRYGMVLADRSGGFTLFAAGAQGYETFPYPPNWAIDIWAGLGAIPFSRLQLLALPAPQPPYEGPPVRNRCNQDAVTGPDAVVDRSLPDRAQRVRRTGGGDITSDTSTGTGADPTGDD